MHFQNASFLQARLQLVEKEFFAEQIETVTSDSPQHGVYRACGKLAIGRVEKRAQQRHHEDLPAAAEALGEGLCVPGKKRHGLDHGQVKQAPLDSPVDGGGRTGIVVWLFQSWCSSLRPLLVAVRRSPYCKQLARRSEAEGALFH